MNATGRTCLLSQSKNVLMKKLIFILCVLLFSGCKKDNTTGTNLVDLTIISTNTPKSLVQGQDIISNVRCSGSNLCYSFSNFEISETSPKIFNIRAMGTYPRGEPVCLLAIYYKDTAVTIKAPGIGRYILRFYNNSLLWKSDTVEVK